MNNYKKIYNAFDTVGQGILFSDNTQLIENLASSSGFFKEVEGLKCSADDEITIKVSIINKGFSIFNAHLYASPKVGELCCVVLPNFILNRTDISEIKAGFSFLEETEEYYKLVEHLSNMILISLKEKSNTAHQYGMWLNGNSWGFEIKGAFELSGFSTN